MKLIDEKGRLFGKVNLIDLLVILLLLAGIFAVVWKLGGKKVAENIADNRYDAEYVVLVENVPTDVAAFAETQLGQPLVNNGKVLDAKITAVGTISVDESHVDLYVTVSGIATLSGNVYSVGPQEVRVGLEYILKTSEFELTGILSDLTVENSHG